jgi:prevent-host-death family protein
MGEIPAGQFKTHCLTVIDQVQQSGEPVVITKHGKPVAKLTPIPEQEDDIFGFMTGKGTIVGDVMNSTAPEDWEWK